MNQSELTTIPMVVCTKPATKPFKSDRWEAIVYVGLLESHGNPMMSITMGGSGALYNTKESVESVANNVVECWNGYDKLMVEKIANEVTLRMVSEKRDALEAKLSKEKKMNTELKELNSELISALQGLVKDVKNKPNDTRYATHIKIAQTALAKVSQR